MITPHEYHMGFMCSMCGFHTGPYMGTHFKGAHVCHIIVRCVISVSYVLLMCITWVSHAKTCDITWDLKEYYEIVGESRPLPAFFPTHGDFFTEMHFYS